MINKDELIYKLNIIIEYLKNNNGYGNPDSNIVENAEDVLDIINLLVDNK